jgi:hypothetical protein
MESHDQGIVEAVIGRLGSWWISVGNPRPARVLRWTAAFGGQVLQVETRGPLRARLSVNGACVDRRSPLETMRRSLPLLSARLDSPDDEVWIAEVYVNGMFAREVVVRVNGKPVPAIPDREDD